jgi:surface protein
MDLLFSGQTSCNPNIGRWNTSAVVSMRGMFWSGSAFNGNIGTGTRCMDHMFLNAIELNQPIGDWNTAAVTDMEWMFYGASAFNQPIGDWNTTAVTSMYNSSGSCAGTSPERWEPGREDVVFELSGCVPLGSAILAPPAGRAHGWASDLVAKEMCPHTSR